MNDMPHRPICAIGLIPYAYLWMFHKSTIGLIVTMNGILYHLIAPDHLNSKRWDIFWNVILVTYVNMYSKYQPECLFLTFIAGMIWLWNENMNSETDVGHLSNGLVHTLGVQFVMAYGLHLYLKGKKTC